MATFRLEFNTDNDAFYHMRIEIMSVLREAIGKIDTADAPLEERRTLHDSNGNSIGHFWLEP